MQRGLRGQRLPSHLHRLKATQLNSWGSGSARWAGVETLPGEKAQHGTHVPPPPIMYFPYTLMCKRLLVRRQSMISALCGPQWCFEVFCCCCCFILTITEASLIQCPLINFLFLMLVQTEACLCALISKQPIKPVIRETAVLWMLVCMYTVNAIVSFFFFFFNCLFCSVLPWNKLTWCCIIAVLLVIKITWKLFCFFFVFLLLKPCEVLTFDPAALKYKSQCANLCLSPLSRALSSLCSSSPKPQTCLHAGNGR